MSPWYYLGFAVGVALAALIVVGVDAWWADRQAYKKWLYEYEIRRQVYEAGVAAGTIQPVPPPQPATYPHMEWDNVEENFTVKQKASTEGD